MAFNLKLSVFLPKEGSRRLHFSISLALFPQLHVLIYKKIILSSLQDLTHTDIWYTPRQATYMRDTLRTRHRRKVEPFDSAVEMWDLPIKYQFATNSFSK